MTTGPGTSAPMRRGVVFVLFALLPWLAYQWVQDRGRGRFGGEPMTDYLLGVAPKALGGLSLTVALAVIVEGRVRATILGLVSLIGLWAWEAAQLWMPGGTFDLHDLAWTVPGVGLGLAAAGFLDDAKKSSLAV